MLLFVLMSLGVLASQRLRTGALEARLVRELNTLTHAGHPRPAHVSPTRAGTFGTALAPLLPALVRPGPAAPPTPEEAARCEAVTEGRSPISDLPASCREALEQGRPLMRQVLAATHAESGGLPEELRPVSGPDVARREALTQALRRVLEQAALETRLLVARGDADPAVDTCLDALALSRELALGGGLAGQRLSAHGYARAWRACADALDAASVPRKRQAVSQLTRLHEGFPPVSLTLHEDSLAEQLLTFRDLLSDDARSLLPPAWLDAPSLPGALSRRLQWRQWVTDSDDLRAVVDQPVEARRRALGALASRRAAAHLRREEAPSARQLSQDMEALDLRALRSEALIALAEVDVARAERGQWPKTLATKTTSLVLEPVDASQATLRSCVRGLTPEALRVTADAPATPRQAREAP
ncbi:hypothetical protein G4177_03695 [Corallococcus sp. ZKHCc1 1396]|uniref:Secreted protein n=2 Tax=Corallococcus soli TaxID=2710757 RepID=A0ABR9PHD9_9BACT|nr:hypothetical protein [Corallococcus soli]MBE4747279.1 hypothetical protein [Corallococcus soli]